MTQSIVIQVGQCGNQIGRRFWDLALREHASINKKGVYDDAMSSFFTNCDETTSSEEPSRGFQKVKNLRARAVLIDMEEGVVSEILRSPMGSLFHHQQLVTDVSGSGNNWAVGYHEYGRKYEREISDVVRKAAECCDCLQCFFLLHSMGGGTGSGLGTFVLRLLEDEYPDIYRFAVPVFPSDEDDVITSPYNSTLALEQLTDHADCVLPIENQALSCILEKINQSVPSDKFGKRVFTGRTPSSSDNPRIKAGSALSDGGAGQQSVKVKDQKPFDAMNNIVANLLLNLTSSSRFEGCLNVDINEITMNLVPFPSMHYLIASQSPMYSLTDLRLASRRLDSMFSDAFSSDHQMVRCDPKHGTYLACALMVRGAVEVSDVRRNIERLRPKLNFVDWNTDGWKVGICSAPPFGHPYSLLALANNSSIWNNFSLLQDGFVKLYSRRAHLHHYTRIDGMEAAQLDSSLESLTRLVESYKGLETSSFPSIARLKIAT